MPGGDFFKHTIRTVPIRGKTVLLRADYNVPIAKDGTIADDFRIRASIPTIRALLTYGCKVVIISHLGRPDGKANPVYSLEPVAARVAELLGHSVRFVDRCVGEKPRMAIKRAPKRTVIVLENLRFHPEEEANDEVFAQRLARDSGAQYFVQDGFGVVHRAHASTAAITNYLPSIAGLLLEKEYTIITEAMKHPARPLVAVLGGAKVSDKAPVIEALVQVADHIVIGGAMANTFLAHDNMYMGDSMVEPGMGDVIERIYAAVRAKTGKNTLDDFLILPRDVGIGTSLELTATRQDVVLPGIPRGTRSLDIGPESVKRMNELVRQARTIIWNGTLGYAEIPAFTTGSTALAKQIAARRELVSIVGGGDTADFVLKHDKQAKGFTHISTGGGASLELMAGKKLPGIERLLDAPRKIKYTKSK